MHNWLNILNDDAITQRGTTVTIPICPGISFEITKGSHELAQELARQTGRIWYVGKGPDGCVVTSDREDLLAQGFKINAGRNHAIAWVCPGGAL